MRGHNLLGGGWTAVFAIVLVIAAHAALVGIATRLHYSVLLAAGVVGMVMLKCSWWKLWR